MTAAEEIWSKVKKILENDLNSIAIETWFGDTTAVDIRDNRLYIHTPTTYKKEQIETRFIIFIKNALYEIFNGDFGIEILTGNENERYLNSVASEKSESTVFDSYTFDRFVVGKSNNLAYNAAKAVAEGITIYNPLFIYGNSGLGKTHLLTAIKLRVKELHPEYNIIYVKGEQFTNELIESIRMGTNLEFREKYRKADLFLMDDIQFIAGKISTQEEFFHTFNALFESNHQVVFTSDRPPSEISKLEDRLRSRFESGLDIDIQPPDYETRMAIIKNKAIDLGFIIDSDIQDYIAKNITANVRQLEGAVKKLKAYAELNGEFLTLDTTEEVLEHFYREGNDIPTPEKIIEITAKAFNISEEAITGKSQDREISNARQVAIYIMRSIINMQFKQIGQALGGRTHSTIIASCDKVEAKMKTDPAFAEQVKSIISTINQK